MSSDITCLFRPDQFFLPELHTNENKPPRVGISACLLGDRVRYDGDSKKQPLISNELQKLLQLERFCPEVSAGLGVPRPPVQLTEYRDSVRAIGVDDSSLDVTDALLETAQEYSSNNIGLCGFIFKARSPSCGLGSTPLFDATGSSTSTTSGIFSSWLQQQHPDWLGVEESFFSSIERCRLFAFFCHLMTEAHHLESRWLNRRDHSTENEVARFTDHYAWLWNNPEQGNINAANIFSKDASAEKSFCSTLAQQLNTLLRQQNPLDTLAGNLLK